jgi:hypothetical protein
MSELLELLSVEERARLAAARDYLIELARKENEPGHTAEPEPEA